MDVACPKCQTEYDLEDSRVPDDGVTVKCSTCGHVFRAKRRSVGVATLVPASDEKASAANELPPASPTREWKLRQPSGAISTCRELTALQRWIVEGKVSRDDEISLTGETWKRLGDIPELASFFRVVDEASRARSYEAERERGSAARLTPVSGLEDSKAAAFVSRSGVGLSPVSAPPPTGPGRGGPMPSVPRPPGSAPLPRASGSALGSATIRGSGTFPALSPSGASSVPGSATLPPLPRRPTSEALGSVTQPSLRPPGSGTFPGSPAGGSPASPPFHTGSSPAPIQSPRIAGSHGGGLSPSPAGGGVPRGSGAFPAPLGVPTPTAWTSGVYPALPGFGSSPSRPPFASSPSPVEPGQASSARSPEGSADPAFVSSASGPRQLPPLIPGGRSTDPNFTTQPSSFGPGSSSGLVPGVSGSGVHRAPMIGSAPAPMPAPVPFPPVDPAAAGGLGPRQTLRGPHFSVPPPSPRISFEPADLGSKELRRARLRSTLVLLVLGLGAATAAVYAYREHFAAPPPASSSPAPAVTPPPQAAQPADRTAADRGQPADHGPVAEAPRPSGPEAVAVSSPELGRAALDGGGPAESARKEPPSEELASLEKIRSPGAPAPAPAPAPKAAEAKGPEPKVTDPREAKRVFDTMLDRADRLRERERPDLAIDLYGRAHELRPDRVEPVAGRGLSLLDLRKYPAAQAAFLQALRLNDRYGPAIMGLAEAYRLQGNNPKAVEFYQRYLEVLPEGAEAAVARNNIQRLKP